MVRNFIPSILVPMVAIALLAGPASAPRAMANTEAGKAADVETSDDHSYLPPAMQHQPNAQEKSKAARQTEVSALRWEAKKTRPRYVSARPRHYHSHFRERPLFHNPMEGLQIFGILFGQ